MSARSATDGLEVDLSDYPNTAQSIILALSARLATATELLQRIEWASDDIPCCPVCGISKGGHGPAGALARFLSEAP